MTDADTDTLIREVREHQAALLDHRAHAKDHQVARDRLVHQLRGSDPERWSYAQIAEATGLTSVNVVKILRKSPTL